MSDGSIKIILDGKDDILSVKDFLSIVRATVNALNTLADGQEWSVGNMSHSSPANFELLPGNEKSYSSTTLFLDGLERLEKGANRPQKFSDLTLKHVKSLTAPLGNGVTRLSFFSEGRDAVRVSQRVSASADEIARSPTYSQNIELEGILGKITVHGTKSEFCIYDPLTDKEIVCLFNRNDAGKVGSLVTHRVRVYGKAKYKRNDDQKHTPASVTVERWVGPIGEDAIPISEIHEAGFKLSSGDSSEDIIRKLRDLDG